MSSPDYYVESSLVENTILCRPVQNMCTKTSATSHKENILTMTLYAGPRVIEHKIQEHDRTLFVGILSPRILSITILID